MVKMWLTFVPIRFLGDHNYCYRIIDALAGVGTVFLTFRLGYLLFGSRAVGIVAALLLLGSPLFLFRHSFREAVQDGPVVFLCTLTMLMGWKAFSLLSVGEADLEPRQRRVLNVYAAGIGLSVGSAVMMKWVAGLLPLILMACYVLVNPRLLAQLWSRARVPLLVATVLSGTLPALYVGPHYLFNRAGIESAAATQIAERLITKGAHHADDWAFYLTELFEKGAAGPPWMIIASVTICAVAAIRLRSKPLLFVLIWALVPLIAFSAMKGRLPWYIYPIFPGLALMAGYAAGGALRIAIVTGRRAISTRNGLAVGLLLAAMSAAFSLACIGVVGKRLVRVTTRVLNEGSRLEIDIAVEKALGSLDGAVGGSGVLFFDFDLADEFSASRIDKLEEIYLSKLIPFSLASANPVDLRSARCILVVTTADRLQAIRQERPVNQKQIMRVANKRGRSMPEFVFIRLVGNWDGLS